MLLLLGRSDALMAVCDVGAYYMQMAVHPDLDEHTLGNVLSIILDIENVLDRGRSVRYPEEEFGNFDLDMINKGMDEIRGSITALMARLGKENARKILEHRANTLHNFNISA